MMRYSTHLACFLVIFLQAPSLHAEVSSGSFTTTQKKSISISPQPVLLPMDLLQSIMRSIRYSKEGFFSLGKPRPVFSETQIDDLANGIQQALASMEPGKAVVFDIDDIEGRVAFSKGMLYWHFERIGNRPAERITYLKEPTATLDDSPTGLSENTIEESYWQLKPQVGQALVSGKPDWITTPATPHVTQTSEATVAAALSRMDHAATSSTDVPSISPREAYRMQQLLGIWLLDVRSKPEFELVGHPLGAANIPYKTYPSWQVNPNFAVKVKNWAGDHTVMVICRSGNRSQAAVQLLRESGMNSINVLEGFEGPKSASGHRDTQQGWRNRGLPWGY